MSKTALIIIAALSAIIVFGAGFGAGWFSFRAYLANSMNSAIEDMDEDYEPEEIEGVEPSSDESVLELTEKYTSGDVSITLGEFSRGRDTYYDDETGADVPDPDGDFVRFSFTVDNGSKDALKLEFMQVECTVGDPGVSAEMGTYGVEGGETGYPPEGPVLPGKSEKAMVTCAMPKDETELQVHVYTDDPESWSLPDVYFAGDVKK